MRDATAWGIETSFTDYRGRRREAPAVTVDAILDAMGAGDDPPPLQADPLHLIGRWRVHTEDGGSVDVTGAVPPDLPWGYHWLEPLEAPGPRQLLVQGPSSCFLPPDLKTWGWAVQLYALRSRDSWGMGDLQDLRRMAEWSRRQGAGMLLVNPLHAAVPGLPQEASPYFPSSRCFRNPLYLRIDDPSLAPRARVLNDERLIDRDAVFELKMAALEKQFEAFGGDAAFDRYCAEQGEILRRYGTFCALTELVGRAWTEWPDVLPAVDPTRMRFHMWLQWMIDDQLRDAGQPLGLMQDVAIGVDAAGADAWMWRECFALGARVGAPPDEFNSQGQDWGLPPLDPWRLMQAGFEPFIRTVRAGFRHAGGLRFDHVMGLFRLYWIPEGMGADQGAYVRYPHKQLLDILALESHRAGAYVVGEDLGTVEQEMREELARRQVLSYRLLWFEQEPPSEYPDQALAAITTHDLPTVAGLWTGADLESQRRIGHIPNEEATAAIRARLQKWTGADGDAVPDDVIRGAYRLLGKAPSRIVTATVDDALAVEERPNMPGTTDQWPNWSLALPASLETLEESELAADIARSLRRPDA
jgi:4-alpha-glucanotransferase